ncbi:hypothetical protein ACVGWD_00070, partial [Enterobacter asburiae]
EGASRRFRAVMMTAVSFIIGVLPLFLGPPAGGPSPPHIRPTVLSGKLVGVCYKKKPPHHTIKKKSFYLLCF